MVDKQSKSISSIMYHFTTFSKMVIKANKSMCETEWASNQTRTPHSKTFQSWIGAITVSFNQSLYALICLCILVKSVNSLSIVDASCMASLSTHSLALFLIMMIFHSIPFIYGCKIESLNIYFTPKYTFVRKQLDRWWVCMVFFCIFNSHSHSHTSYVVFYYTDAC